MNKIYLKSCPFCGGSAYILKARQLFTVAYHVVCSCCDASDTPRMTGLYMRYNGQSNVFVTDKMAITDAVNKWNSRSAHT